MKGETIQRKKSVVEFLGPRKRIFFLPMPCLVHAKPQSHSKKEPPFQTEPFVLRRDIALVARFLPMELQLLTGLRVSQSEHRIKGLSSQVKPSLALKGKARSSYTMTSTREL